VSRSVPLSTNSRDGPLRSHSSDAWRVAAAQSPQYALLSRRTCVPQCVLVGKLPVRASTQRRTITIVVDQRPKMIPAFLGIKLACRTDLSSPPRGRRWRVTVCVLRDQTEAGAPTTCPLLRRRSGRRHRVRRRVSRVATSERKLEVGGGGVGGHCTELKTAKPVLPSFAAAPISTQPRSARRMHRAHRLRLAKFAAGALQRNLPRVRAAERTSASLCIRRIDGNRTLSRRNRFRLGAANRATLRRRNALVEQLFRAYLP